ncbi:hypothetical protein [Peptostreptococcus equinus]|uniref:DUF2577 domain-containing protein n=1 Tax=Peptostreptococcus equinus TaxID=3003601 RepID=A0ABY7JN00_9FIRM|nr:hypothetical protein [Peptostreptococcus sp. CBA3647]WAW14743.1 hypothetical protein O0R46_09180 [Peptostreptococcus sp. CBA3647]
MNGYEALKGVINDIAKERESKLKNIYFAKVISMSPFLISSNFLDTIGESQLSILNSIDKHSFKVGDELLVVLYEQELIQKFIIIDKVVNI